MSCTVHPQHTQGHIQAADLEGRAQGSLIPQSCPLKRRRLYWEQFNPWISQLFVVLRNELSQNPQISFLLIITTASGWWVHAWEKSGALIWCWGCSHKVRIYQWRRISPAWKERGAPQVRLWFWHPLDTSFSNFRRNKSSTQYVKPMGNFIVAWLRWW